MLFIRNGTSTSFSIMVGARNRTIRIKSSLYRCDAQILKVFNTTHYCVLTVLWWPLVRNEKEVTYL